ncbi:hypothetical protein [Neorhizobium sp. JUb45]|uniref:hypothetical protein n=1 Tax=Neorhizobium sp. JUb45 TaxID=2485113 RepID=UPI0010EBEE58|nr:hypothetical protein [Neorhizobium sp. JUb45]TCQ99411.1 hypothetical protein EDF70_109117 [Neorhizobium sp. JUb45]
MLTLFLTFGWLWHIGQFPSASVAKLFIVLWVVMSLVNMWIGVSKAGYSISEELFVLPQVLLPPVLAAGLVLLAS